MVPGITPKTLPPVRQDLSLYEAPAAPDGSPCWHLHDPCANQFYQIGWTAFEVLSRWHLGSADAIMDAISAESTLDIDAETVRTVAQFLEQNHLLTVLDASGSARLTMAKNARKLHWAKWLLHNYLFFRIPLVRPHAWLGNWVHWVRPALEPRFWLVAGLLALTALVLIVRQWEQFVHGFTAYSGLSTALAFGVTLSVAKVAHELGHALMARHYGCKVPTMGIALLVLWPVLYTDTNEAWKLSSHRARMHIALAGMATETLVAMLASWAWLLLPDGPARSAAFFMATTSWVMTLALNASPFMRFDGYFLLVDALGMPNLHARAFAFGRWWLREKLFALNDPMPEPVSPTRKRMLVGFAFATWLYRLTLFISIALLVYYAFFKALGIVLMVVEVAWFIVLPFTRELRVWWQWRGGMAWNTATRRTAILFVLLVIAMVVPWQNQITLSATLAPALEQNIYAPFAATITTNAAAERSTVKQGETLIELASPDLEQRRRLAQISAATWRTLLEQQAFHENLLRQGSAVQSHAQEAQAQLSGLTQELARLRLTAAFDGEILYRADGLNAGTWVTPREKLLTIADRRQSTVEAFVGERERDRLHVGATAYFVATMPEAARRTCRVAEIDTVNIDRISDPALASVYGGTLASRLDAHGEVIPVHPLYRLRLHQCQPAQAPRLRLHGVVHVDADRQSIIESIGRHVLPLLIRESGF
jgi:putative peptide zinc metalloprotease protein